MGQRRLMLLRHAKSSWPDSGPASGPDRDRPLSRRGEHAAPLIGAWIAARGTPDLILCSTARRARQTLAGLGVVAVAQHFEEALYMATAEALLARLRSLAEETRHVLLIGHNPGLQALGAMLAEEANRGLAERIAGTFPTAALALFDLRLDAWSDLGPGAVAAATLVGPREVA